MSAPLVSCICPTMESRKDFLPRAIESFLRQDYPNREMIVVSDGYNWLLDLARDLGILEDRRILFYAAMSGMSLGGKRNLAAAFSRGGPGDLICHFDDDDLSRHDRISDQVELLELSGLSVVGYHSTVVHELGNVRVVDNGLMGLVTGKMESHRGSPWWRMQSRTMPFGTSLMYRRDWWRAHEFLPVSMGEDDAFSSIAIAQKQMLSVEGFNRMTVTNHAGNVTNRVPGGIDWQELDGKPAEALA